MKKLSVKLFLLVLFIPLISATQFGYNYLDNKDNVLEGANYSINVNNTNYHQGLTPQQVANLFDASAYYLKSNPFGFYNSTTLPAQTDYNSTGLILNWSKLIQPFNLQQILDAGNIANKSIILENTETDPYCQGSPVSPYCYDNYFNQMDCEAYNGHNACYWNDYGECSGDTFSYCYYSYPDEMSCNGDIYGGCYWDSSSEVCYPTTDCYYNYYDESSCNSALDGYTCYWDDYSYCENYDTLTCSQTGEDECSAVGGCDWETDVNYTSVTTGQFISTAPTGLSPFVISSTTKVTDLNCDLLDGSSSENFLKSTTTGLTLPALSDGKFLKSGASSLSWEDAVSGSNTKYGTPPSTARYLASWTSQDTGTTTIGTARNPNNGGATLMFGDFNGQHYIITRLDNGAIGGFGMGSSGSARVGLIDPSTFGTIAGIIFSPAGTISTSNLFTFAGGFSATGDSLFRILNGTTLTTAELNPNIIKSTIIGDYDNLSADKITNGAFTGNANGWTLSGYTYGGNRLNKANGVAGTAIQTNANMVTPLVNGEVYKLTFTHTYVSDGGSMTVTAGGQTLGTYNAVSSTTPIYFKCIDDTQPLTFTASSAGRIILDNVVLTKVQSGDLDVVGNLSSHGLQGINLECSGGINITKITGGLVTNATCL